MTDAKEQLTTTAAADEDTKDPGPEALSIFSGYVLNNAVAENNKLRAENASLQAPRDLLLRARLRLSTREVDLWAGVVHDFETNGGASARLDFGEEEDGVGGQDEFLAVSVDDVDPIPLGELRGLSFSAAGFTVSPHFYEPRPWGSDATVKDDDTVKMILSSGELACWWGPWKTLIARSSARAR